MDIKSFILKLPQRLGGVPPGTDKIIEILSQHPKLSLFCTTVIIGCSVYHYFSRQKYPAPWLDRRVIKTNLTKKEILEANFKPEVACTKQWDVIVIGAGLSGLTTANLMARSGLSVLVLEKHYIAGGNTHVWHDQGREFDTGVHYVGAGTDNKADSTGATLHFLTDNKLKWQPLDDNFDTVVLNDGEGNYDRFKITKKTPGSERTWDTLEDMLKERFPDEHTAIDTFLEDMKLSTKGSLALGLYKMLPKSFLKIFMYFGLHNRFLHNEQLTTTARDYFNSITTNKQLQCVMNYCFGDYGTQPSQAPQWMAMTLPRHFRNGGIFPVGGSSAITKAIAEPIWARNGKVLVRANVQEICIENGKATGVTVQPTFVGSDGESVFVSAKHVVSTISVWHTNKIVKNPTLKQNIDHLRPGWGAFYVWFGMTKDCPEVPSRNWWCYNTDKGYDFDELVDKYAGLDMDGYFESPAPLMFVSFPSAKDPEYHERNPSKGATGVIITFAKWEWYTQLQPEHEKRWGVSFKKIRPDRPKDYVAIRDRMGRQILEQAQEFIPEVNFLEHVDYVKVGTPLSQRQYLNMYNGAMYSADHDMSRFAPENLVKSRPETPISNLTQVTFRRPAISLV